MGEPMEWAAVVVTCQTRDTATAFQQELRHKQKLGAFPGSTLVLAVEDPRDGVGSGGATLNALLVVAEHISAQRNYGVVNPDVLYDSKILIFNLGREYGYEPCGRAFLSLPVHIPVTNGMLTTNLDALYYIMTNKIAASSPPGVWECSTDMLLEIPEQLSQIDLTSVDACALSVPGSLRYATRHGIYKVSKQGDILDIIYRGTSEQIQDCSSDGSTVPLVAGVIFFSPRVAESLVSFHTSPPLDACTYIGVDSGAKPLQLTLFFDLLLAMCGSITEQDFVSGMRGDSYGRKRRDTTDATMMDARRMIWKSLSHFRAKIMWVPDGRHLYLEDEEQSILELMADLGSSQGSALRRSSDIHSYSEDTISGIVTHNSIINRGCTVGEGSTVINSNIGGNFSAGKNCYISGIDKGEQDINIDLPDHTVLLGVNVRAGNTFPNTYRVVVTWGTKDKLMVPVCSAESTFCKQSWADFFKKTKTESQDIWENSISENQKCLWNAKLFPLSDSIANMSWMFENSSDEETLGKWKTASRVSLEQILKQVDFSKEFCSRRSLHHEISKHKIRSTLLGVKGQGLLGLYRAAVHAGKAHDILSTLDEIACECGTPGIAARTLANIADVLGAMAQGKGGLRSGPAANYQWKRAFQLLEKEDIAGGIRALAEERTKWLTQPELLVRAARHYEGAAQILIRHAVMTARQFIRTTPCDRPEVGQWVVAESPARIDIAGGWSDTPPITYEHGGAVINAAITLDGKRPIGAKICRITEPVLELHIGTSADVSSVLTLTELEQLSDYNNPQSQGALLKAAFICAEIVEFPSSRSLAAQLSDEYGGGFKLYSWSNLPHGSGLGTSSILAGAIMAALWTVSGRKFDIDALNHAVAHLEQMLTTGGGWQDQVGGLTGGVKVGHSAAALPMRIEVAYPQISQETLQAFSDRLVLVYTGKTRLARNLLQNVLRNWYARDPEIVETEDDLVRTAWQCAKAFENGDLEVVGACMNHYWDLKKRMAPGCEPQSVTEMMACLRQHALGLSLAGAGGGGFLYVLTREPHAVETVRSLLRGLVGAENATIHESAVDTTGLQITIENKR